ncbi:MAG: ankyrin repeat domain-containing protein [Candidatus Hydrogenedentes bacterium]|nr:ankyrin repeat domain-containing protein [Candidatus Hydrogenedentota bacterium]
MLLILTSVPTIYLKQYVTLEKAVQSGNVELARKRLQFNLLGVGARNGYIMRISSIGTIPGPLMPVAAQTGNVQMARLLMAHGATADDRNQFMSPPVTEAAMKGHADMVEFLLQNGAIADEAWPGSYNDYPRIVEIVLEYGGSPDLGLRSAATAGSIESLELLLDKGADINYVDATGYSVLDYAGSAHVSDAFDFILSQGGKLHNLGPAVRTGNLRVVKLGLDQGVNPNGQPEGDYTFPPLVEAMMYLTVHGDDGRLNRAATPDVYLSIVEALLRAGADANIDSKFGTPLSVIVGAALSLEEERECLMPMLISAVELLVAFGADPTCIPSNSQEQYSPLELARTFGRRELLDAMTASIP